MTFNSIIPNELHTSQKWVKVPQYFPEGILSFSQDKSHKYNDKKYTECKFLNFQGKNPAIEQRLSSTITSLER